MSTEGRLQVIRIGLAATAILTVGAWAGAQQPTVKVGWLKHAPSAALYLLPQFTEKHRVKVELVEFKRYADTRTAVASGSLDFALVGPQDVPLVVAQGETNLVVVMGLAKGADVLVVRKGVDIRSWNDYMGKRIGVGKGGIAWMKFLAGMQEHGVDYSKLNIINIAGGGDEHVKGIRRGEIDVSAIWEPYGAMAVSEGLAYYAPTDLGATRTVGPMNAVIVANRKMVDGNPDLTQKMVTALVQSTDHLRTNRDQWIAAVRQFTGLEADVTTLSLKTLDYDIRLPQETIETMAKFLYRIGILTRDVSAELFQKHYTYRFLENATGKSARELGAR
jgi:ABC-type nitrate/sulfonate/bicarbonate transport system substrate-binding protein